MKNALMVFVLLALIVNANCQKTDSSALAAPLTKEDYLEKSKNLKVLGFIALGAGIGMIAGGVSMINKSIMDESNSGAILFVAGVVTTIVSIPIFISAGRNRRRAASISLNNFNYPVMQEKSIARAIPAITLKVQLKRSGK